MSDNINFDIMDSPIIATPDAMSAMQIGGDFNFNANQALNEDPDFMGNKAPYLFDSGNDLNAFGGGGKSGKPQDPQQQFQQALGRALKPLESAHPGITRNAPDLARQLGIDMAQLKNNPDKLKTLKMAATMQHLQNQGRPPVIVSDDMGLVEALQGRFKVMSSDEMTRQLNQNHPLAKKQKEIESQTKIAKKMDSQRMDRAGLSKDVSAPPQPSQPEPTPQGVKGQEKGKPKRERDRGIDM